jgi:glycosyltransferase involved in cell wall biosynthesis
VRLAFFTTRMTLGYGVDLTIHEIASRLVAEFGHQVDVWTPTSDGTYRDAPYNLREIIVHGAAVNRVLPLLELNAWRALRRLRRRLAADGESYDIVVPCTHPYYSVGRALGLPSIFFNFGNVPTAGFSWKGKLNWAWLDFSERWLTKPANTSVVSISRFLHDQQTEEVKRKGRAIHLGGDHYYPAPDGAGVRFRARHGINTQAVLLGYCGRLHRDHPPYKGTSELLELGRRVTAANPRAELVLCGIGSPADAAWVREQGAIAAANLPPREMPGFYDALDIYVCASRWEGFNLPIVEAAWHSVPAVAYDAGAHREHVTAVLAPDGDFEALVNQTQNLVQDEKHRAQLAARAGERARQFSWDRAAQEFNTLLTEVRP